MSVAELLSENFDATNDDDVARFSMLAGLHQELKELIAKKLFESIELQQYLIEKEIEYLEKYTGSLSQPESRFNNHNDLEQVPVSLSPTERALAVESAHNKLNGLLIRKANLGRREQKACEYFSSSELREIKFVVPRNVESTGILNATWILALQNSTMLRKIHLVCDKLKELSNGMELSFWSSEIQNLLEKLTIEEKPVAFAILIAMTLHKYEESPEAHNVFMSILKVSLENDELSGSIVDCLEKLNAIESGSAEQSLILLKVLSSAFVKLHSENHVLRDRMSKSLCSQTVKILELDGLTEEHLESVVEVFEGVLPRVGATTGRFERMFGMLQAKAVDCGDESLQLRIRRLMTFGASEFNLPVISTDLTNYVASATNENPLNTEELLRRIIDEELRRSRELARNEEVIRRQEEKKRKKEIAEIKKTIEEEYAKQVAEDRERFRVEIDEFKKRLEEQAKNDREVERREVRQQQLDDERNRRMYEEARDFRNRSFGYK